jgi:hypothetical protein
MSAHVSHNPLTATRRNTQALEAQRQQAELERIQADHAAQRAAIRARPPWRLPEPRRA